MSWLVECLFTTHEALGSVPGFATSDCDRVHLCQQSPIKTKEKNKQNTNRNKMEGRWKRR